MDLSEQVREFRVLQKTHRIRVADFCRERTLDYYEMVEALKKDKGGKKGGKWRIHHMWRWLPASEDTLPVGNVNPYDYWEVLLTNSCNPTRTIDSFMPHLWSKQP